MPSEQSERRRAVRREPTPDEPLSRVRLRTGRELTVVNVSASGALVEGLARLVPNTHADVHVVTRHGRVLVRSRIVRAFVWRLERDSVRYRTALAFDVPIDIAPAAVNQVTTVFPLRGAQRAEGPRLEQAEHAGRIAPNDRIEPTGYALPGEITGNTASPGTAYPESAA